MLESAFRVVEAKEIWLVALKAGFHMITMVAANATVYGD